MRRCCTIFSLLVLWTGVAMAQPSGHATLTGLVLDDDTGEPLAGVHVFIASSLIGTTTDAEGVFRLRRVPLGAQRLVVSMIGFEPIARDLFLEEAQTYEYDFDLSPRVYELGQITVEGERDPRWQRRLKRFIRLFIGETRYAEETEILNPEVLDFEHKEGRFTAWAAEPLIIENRALGYRIQYLLIQKETSSAFAKELIVPGKTQVVGVVYLGELEDEAYLKWQNRSWAQPGMQSSYLELESGPAIFDYKGDLLDPYSVTMHEYLSFDRVADSLPKEYRPPNWPP